MLFLLPPILFGGQSVSLSWDPSTDPNVAGYRVYSGTASHDYSGSLDVGSATGASVPVPLSGVTYYFAVTAYDSLGNQSDFSNEAYYSTPSTNGVLTSITLANGQFGFTVSGNDGHRCILQTSTNLSSWTAVLTNVAPFTYAVSNTIGSGVRFYRAAFL